jgi:adenine-specific DNA-methyltransferase
MASVLLQQKKITVSKEEFVHFINEVVPEKGFISNNFKNAYYTDQENNWLDGIAIKIHSLKNKEQQAVYFYCLFQACLQKRPFNLFHRENLNLRLKNVKRSFGNLKTWNTEFTTLMLRSYVQLNINSKGKKIKACVKPATDALKVKGKYDLVYLDPPYVDKKANSDTYLKKYHFLEGLSSYYEWDEKLVNCGSRYNHDNINMELAKNKVLFESYLFKLIKKYKGSIVVLSYMSEAYPSKEVFEQVFKKMFLSVKVIEKEFSHVLAKSKRNEFLIIGIPNDK